MAISEFPGGGGGAGGPAPNTVLWTTADRHYNGTDIAVRIPRMSADLPDGRKVPIATDRIAVGSREAIIRHVEHPAGETFTTLILEEPLGADLEPGDIIRIDRRLYAEVASDSVNGALSRHTANVQPTLRIQGAGGAFFTVTFRARNGQHVGAARNGTQIRLRHEDGDYDGVTHNADFSIFTITSFSELSDFNLLGIQGILQHLAGGFFTVSAVAGSGNAIVTGVQWEFAGGITTSAGSTEAELHALHSDIAVGDVVVFTGQDPDKTRVISAVTHTADETTIEWEDELDFAYADDGAVRIDRSVGYAQSIASVSSSITETVVRDYVRPPFAFFWAEDATRRYMKVPHVDLGGAAEEIALKFRDNNGSPDEPFYDPDGVFDNILLNEPEMADMDAIQWPVAGQRDRVGFKPLAGVYKLKVYSRYSTRTLNATGVSTIFREVKSGTDDDILEDDFDRGEAENEIAIGRLETDEFSTDGTKKFYVHLILGQTGKDISYYIRLERVGDVQ